MISARPYLGPALPVAALAVSLLVMAATMATVWCGSALVAHQFTSSHKDSPYLLSGLLILIVATVPAFLGWLLVERSVPVYQEDRAALAYLALVVALPMVAGIATDIVGARQWRVRHHPSARYSLSAPPKWVVSPGSRPDQPPESMTLWSWFSAESSGPIPSNGLMIVVRPLDGPAPAGEPFAVGQGRYPTTIGVPSRVGDTSDHAIVIAYVVEGRTWQITGLFAEPPDTSNTNLKVFRDVVASLRHTPLSEPDPALRSKPPAR